MGGILQDDPAHLAATCVAPYFAHTAMRLILLRPRTVFGVAFANERSFHFLFRLMDLLTLMMPECCLLLVVVLVLSPALPRSARLWSTIMYARRILCA